MEDSLLAVIEVPKDDRVLCQYKKCNHPIYKRIHIVRINEQLMVIGSTCYGKHFKTLISDSTPIYTSSDGKTLTEEERELLRQNTLNLVQKLKQEYLHRIDLEAKQKLELEEQQRKLKETLNKQIIQPIKPIQREINFTNPYIKKEENIDEQLMAICMAKAKEYFRNEKGLDPELAGWKGWVKSTAKKYYYEMKKNN